MTKNVSDFVDLCSGEFGRKVAYTYVDEITKENVVKIVGEAVSVLNHNRPMIRYLHRYYRGDQPILYRQKTVRPTGSRFSTLAVKRIRR